MLIKLVNKECKIKLLTLQYGNSLKLKTFYHFWDKQTQN